MVIKNIREFIQLDFNETKLDLFYQTAESVSQLKDQDQENGKTPEVLAKMGTVQNQSHNQCQAIANKLDLDPIRALVLEDIFSCLQLTPSQCLRLDDELKHLNTRSGSNIFDLIECKHVTHKKPCLSQNIDMNLNDERSCELNHLPSQFENLENETSVRQPVTKNVCLTLLSKSSKQIQLKENNQLVIDDIPHLEEEMGIDLHLNSGQCKNSEVKSHEVTTKPAVAGVSRPSVLDIKPTKCKTSNFREVTLSRHVSLLVSGVATNLKLTPRQCEEIETFALEHSRPMICNNSGNVLDTVCQMKRDKEFISPVPRNHLLNNVDFKLYSTLSECEKIEDTLELVLFKPLVQNESGIAQGMCNTSQILKKKDIISPSIVSLVNETAIISKSTPGHYEQLKELELVPFKSVDSNTMLDTPVMSQITKGTDLFLPMSTIHLTDEMANLPKPHQCEKIGDKLALVPFKLVDHDSNTLLDTTTNMIQMVNGKELILPMPIAYLDNEMTITSNLTSSQSERIKNRLELVPYKSVVPDDSGIVMDITPTIPQMKSDTKLRHSTSGAQTVSGVASMRNITPSMWEEYENKLQMMDFEHKVHDNSGSMLETPSSQMRKDRDLILLTPSVQLDIEMKTMASITTRHYKENELALVPFKPLVHDALDTSCIPSMQADKELISTPSNHFLSKIDSTSTLTYSQSEGTRDKLALVPLEDVFHNDSGIDLDTPSMSDVTKSKQPLFTTPRSQLDNGMIFVPNGTPSQCEYIENKMALVPFKHVVHEDSGTLMDMSNMAQISRDDKPILPTPIGNLDEKVTIMANLTHGQCENIEDILELVPFKPVVQDNCGTAMVSTPRISQVTKHKELILPTYTAHSDKERSTMDNLSFSKYEKMDNKLERVLFKSVVHKDSGNLLNISSSISQMTNETERILSAHSLYLEDDLVPVSDITCETNEKELVLVSSTPVLHDDSVNVLDRMKALAIMPNLTTSHCESIENKVKLVPFKPLVHDESGIALDVPYNQKLISSSSGHLANKTISRSNILPSQCEEIENKQALVPLKHMICYDSETASSMTHETTVTKLKMKALTIMPTLTSSEYETIENKLALVPSTSVVHDDSGIALDLPFMSHMIKGNKLLSMPSDHLVDETISRLDIIPSQCEEVENKQALVPLTHVVCDDSETALDRSSKTHVSKDTQLKVNTLASMPDLTASQREKTENKMALVPFKPIVHKDSGIALYADSMPCLIEGKEQISTSSGHLQDEMASMYDQIENTVTFKDMVHDDLDTVLDISSIPQISNEKEMALQSPKIHNQYQMNRNEQTLVPSMLVIKDDLGNVLKSTTRQCQQLQYTHLPSTPFAYLVGKLATALFITPLQCNDKLTSMTRATLQSATKYNSTIMLGITPSQCHKAEEKKSLNFLTTPFTDMCAEFKTTAISTSISRGIPGTELNNIRNKSQYMEDQKWTLKLDSAVGEKYNFRNIKSNSKYCQLKNINDKMSSYSKLEIFLNRENTYQNPKQLMMQGFTAQTSSFNAIAWKLLKNTNLQRMISTKIKEMCKGANSELETMTLTRCNVPCPEVISYLKETKYFIPLPIGKLSSLNFRPLLSGEGMWNIKLKVDHLKCFMSQPPMAGLETISIDERDIPRSHINVGWSLGNHCFSLGPNPGRYLIQGSQGSKLSVGKSCPPISIHAENELPRKQNVTDLTPPKLIKCQSQINEVKSQVVNVFHGKANSGKSVDLSLNNQMSLDRLTSELKLCYPEYTHKDRFFTPKIEMNIKINVYQKPDGSPFKTLGTGSFGTVVYGECTTANKSHRNAAIKVFYHSSYYETKALEEIFIQKYLEDTGIVPKIYGIGTDSHGAMMIAMELIGLDLNNSLITPPYIEPKSITLYTILQSLHPMKDITEEQWISIGLQLCYGLAKIHSTGVCITDIKESNIALKKVSGKNRWKVFFIDFGSASYRRRSVFTLKSNALSKSLHLAPEIHCGGRMSSRADMWSLGEVFQKMAGKTKMRPFEKLSKVLLVPSPFLRPNAHEVGMLLLRIYRDMKTSGKLMLK